MGNEDKNRTKYGNPKFRRTSGKLKRAEGAEKGMKYKLASAGKRIIFTVLVLIVSGFVCGQNNVNGKNMGTKKALVIIDIQNDYFEGGANPLSGSLEASMNAKAILKDFREKSLPVVHIQHFSKGAGATFFIPNTKGVEIHENVMPMNGEKVIAKNFPNSFRETDLLDYLKSNNITDLVICGMMTHICIDATTRAAKDFGFTCVVIGDACATKDLEIQGENVVASEVQKSFLAALNYFYSTVKNTQEYLDER